MSWTTKLPSVLEKRKSYLDTSDQQLAFFLCSKSSVNSQINPPWNDTEINNNNKKSAQTGKNCPQASASTITQNVLKIPQSTPQKQRKNPNIESTSNSFSGIVGNRSTISILKPCLDSRKLSICTITILRFQFCQSLATIP